MSVCEACGQEIRRRRAVRPKPRWSNTCPYCGAPPFEDCVAVWGESRGRRTETHTARMRREL